MALRMISLFSSRLNPLFSTETLYLPGGSCGATNTPTLLLLTCRDNLVEGSVMTTTASAIGAPAVSFTVPVIEPLVLWPIPYDAANTNRSRAEIDHLK